MSFHVQTDISLKDYNTFGFDQNAEYFCAVSNDTDLESALLYAHENDLRITILGGGSNIVLTSDVAGLVIHPAYANINFEQTDKAGACLVRCGAGVDWNQLVTTTLEHGYQGLENLSLIPGSVGAAPVQNIGAYGVEVGQRISSLRAIHIPTSTWHEFSAEQCQFSYRHSLFKRHANEYVITEVCFLLGNCNPLSYTYASLAQHLDAQGISEPTALQISAAVQTVRLSRLPSPSELGNAGSFFHNPIVDDATASDLQARFPGLPAYPAPSDQVKLSAGWLIDNAGLKGVRDGDIGVYEKQALVLVNYGSGTGQQLLQFAANIQEHIRVLYGVDLMIEPTVM